MNTDNDRGIRPFRELRSHRHNVFVEADFHHPSHPYGFEEGETEEHPCGDRDCNGSCAEEDTDVVDAVNAGNDT